MIIFHFEVRYLGNRLPDFDDFFANCFKFHSLFILNKERFLKIMNFEKSSKKQIFPLKNAKLTTVHNSDPDFGFRFSDQKLVGIRQNLNRGHFIHKICRPVLSWLIISLILFYTWSQIWNRIIILRQTMQPCNDIFNLILKSL